MSGDDSFFGPRRGGERPNLFLAASPSTPASPGSSEIDSSGTADATFFGHGAAHRHPALGNLSDLAEIGSRPGSGSGTPARRGHGHGNPVAAVLTPGSRAEVEAYRQQVRQEGRQVEFASSAGESFLGDEEYEYYGEDDTLAHTVPEDDTTFVNGRARHHEMDEEGEVVDEEIYEESESSSAIFEPDNDPIGFAERLDQLAGIMEMGETEVQALKWGPSMNRGEYLSIEDFKAVINHHLAATEWKYEPISAPRLGNGDYPVAVEGGERHPIPVLGRSWAGRGIAAQDIDSFTQPMM